MTDIRYDNDYSLFNSQQYCKTYYNEVQGDQLNGFFLDSFLRIYDSGKISGTTILDFGTGPTIHNLITASKYFSNIYLSDYSENNRSALWRWLTKHPEGHDFSPFFNYLREKDPTAYPLTVEDEMRTKIKGILACDMTQGNPLYPSIYPQFDVISSSLCLETSPNIAEYEKAAKNLSSLLKPGGWLVLTGELEGDFYLVGQSKFFSLPLTSGEVKRVWSDLGFQVDIWLHFDLPVSEGAANTEPLCNCPYMFCMAARKL